MPLGSRCVPGEPRSPRLATSPSPPPACRGVSSLFLGWGTSPVLASTAAAVLFFMLRTLVLRSKNSHERALYVMPLAVTLTTFVITFTVIQVRCAR